MRRSKHRIARRSALWVSALACAGLPAARLAAQPPIPQPVTCQGALVAADGAAGDRFGAAVALAGGTAAVGAPGADPLGADSGAAYSFVGGAPQGPRLAPVHGAAGDRFGFATAVAGDRLVGGAPFRDQAGAESGAAYVFRRQGALWVEDTPSLIAAGEAAGDQVGFAVAIAGDLALVGAPGDDDRGTDAGAVYVFTRGAAGWAQAAKLTAGDGAGGDRFGSSLALAGGTLLAGAPGDDGSAGAVYAFTGGGAAWSQQAKLTAGDRAAGSRFGHAVDLAGEAAAVGAPGASGTGAAYVFRRSGGVWSEEARLLAPVAAGDELGVGVAIDGGIAVAGARFDDAGAANSGAVYVFTFGGGGWQASFKLKAAAPAGGAELGFAVTLAGAGLLAGAPGSGAGAVCAFTVPGPPPPPPPPPPTGADLSITKTDGVAAAVPGTTIVYTVRAANAGPNPVVGAPVADVFPSSLACTWTCAGTGGGGCAAGPVAGAIADGVSLPAGGAVTYTATCAIAPAATGTLTNLATIASPAGGPPDPASGDNAATDVDVLTPVTDLAVVKTAGGPAVPGGTLVYTVAVTNAGPSTAAGATVTDTFPAGLACTWTCAAAGGALCTAGPVAGNLADSVTLPPGAGVSATYTAACAVAPSAAGFLANTATATPQEGAVDPTPANASSTVNVPVVPTADLSIAKAAGGATATSGGTLTYTITAGNAGPSAVTDAVVSDAFPAGLACSWTCAAAGGAACTPGPVAGDLADLPDLPPGATATYTATCAIAPTTQGQVCNAATVAAPAGVTDPTPGNDATEPVCVEVNPIQADLGVAKNGPPQAIVGAPINYSIVVTNAGPGGVEGALVTDLFSAALAGASWTCAAAGGASCPAGGMGDIAESVDLPPGGSVTFTVTGVAAAPCGLDNTAAVEPPAGVVDPVADNDSSTVATLVFPQNGVAGCKQLLSGPHLPGSPVTYGVLILNGGPAPLPDGPGDEFRDQLPAALDNVAANASSGAASVVGNLVAWNGTVQPGQFVSIVITAQVADDAPVGLEICNQGLIFTPLVVLTDDPALPGTDDPTCFLVASVVEVPTLSEGALALLVLLLAALAVRRLRAG